MRKFPSARFAAITILALNSGTIPSTACASAPAAEGHGEADGAPEAPPRLDVLDLGAFRIRGSQATDREVIDLKFGVWLVLSESTTLDEFHQLEASKHRLRDQVITAVRGARMADYNEPTLRRLQRLVILRLSRLDLPAKILNVLVTDFSLDRGETLQDLMVPPVTPSATPKKPAGGGH